VEVLPALAKDGGRVPHVHAFQQMGHDVLFTHQFAAHLDTSGLTLHAVEDIGVETAVEMQAAIGRGDLVLMAGDRVSAGSRAVLRHGFLGHDCSWPKGVFTFARLMESPVFFVTCVRTGWNAYEAHFEQAEGDVFDAYVRFLERETRARPDQWHHFHDFFGHA
jgi:predicted LPLAT superfamily acyltransferase